MCDCIEALSRMGYLQPNLLKQGQYFLYPITLDKNQRRKVGKAPVLVRYCPQCGEKLEVES